MEGANGGEPAGNSRSSGRLWFILDGLWCGRAAAAAAAPAPTCAWLVPMPAAGLSSLLSHKVSWDH